MVVAGRMPASLADSGGSVRRRCEVARDQRVRSGLPLERCRRLAAPLVSGRHESVGGGPARLTIRRQLVL